jgi:predicted metal-dependent hydrolase
VNGLTGLFQKAKGFEGPVGPVPVWQMPEEIALLAIDLTWSVLTRRDDINCVVIREMSDKTLVIQGAIDNTAACQTGLKCWLTGKAEDHLLLWLRRESDKTGLSYTAASIRQQQTRWGSCSSRRLFLSLRPVPRQLQDDLLLLILPSNV